MPGDPGLVNDTCIFMEAIPGDQGTHNAQRPWWLSADITLTGPVSGPDTADSGQVNTIKAKFHRKSAASGCHFPGDESITIELWVANPSLVMAPRVRGSATRVEFIGAPVPNEGDSGIEQIDWTPPAGLPADNPQAGGPKCLVARCYPDSGAPSAASFFLPDDQHVAQRNLCVVTTTTHGVVFKVNTLNLDPSSNPLQPSQVKLRALLDLAPNHFIASTVMARLHLISGFQQLRTKGLTGGFKFDLTGFTVSQVIDHSHQTLTLPQPLSPAPSFEAHVALPARGVVPIPFAANLSGVNAGEACIFHLIQTSMADVAEGGLTLVVVKL
jgi:hypothetical protein